MLFSDGSDIIYTNWKDGDYWKVERDYLMIDLDTGKWADENGFARMLTLCQLGKAHVSVFFYNYIILV